jgi:hypothetical protein
MTITIDGTAGITFPNGTNPQDAPCKVLQVVSTTKSDSFSTSSTSFVDVTGLSASITPLFSTSKILVIINMQISAPSNNFMPVNLVRNTTAIAQPSTGSYQSTMNGYPGDVSNATSLFNIGMNYLDSPATTSSTTYKIQAYVTAGTGYVNTRASGIGSQISTITLMEIAQ